MVLSSSGATVVAAMHGIKCILNTPLEQEDLRTRSASCHEVCHRLISHLIFGRSEPQPFLQWTRFELEV
ncbi:hypothetical protein RHSIM_Rhsim01G0044600 [Rhododendron simsii]|uniref:Uncharacterized protein n=1 Tax=Rhododendron simsii TaxID=118357 RepID=A0A834HK17_RHOSS|nr:hypothetical protein RHSIM_Rhsim01G0044600 [Rhododendron simsii]